MIELHTAGHRRGVVCRAARRRGRSRPRHPGRGRQRARSHGGDGGDHRRRLSAHEPHRRRRLLAGSRAEQARPRDHGGGPGRLARHARALPRARGDSRRAGRLPRSPCRARSAAGCWRWRRHARSAAGACRSTLLLHAAIGQARDGYVVAKSQARLTTEKLAELKNVPGFAETFLPDGKPPEAGRQAQAERARLHARSSGAQRTRRFLSRRRRARDRRRPGEDRQPGDARRLAALPRQHRRATQRQAQRRDDLQHAAADAGPGLAHHPRAVRAPARPRSRKLRVRSRSGRGDQARVSRARPRRHRSGAGPAAAQRNSSNRNSSTPRFSRSTPARRRNGRRPMARATPSGWAPPTPRASRCPTSSRSIGSSAPAACCPKPAC